MSNRLPGTKRIKCRFCGFTVRPAYTSKGKTYGGAQAIIDHVEDAHPEERRLIAEALGPEED